MRDILKIKLIYLSILCILFFSCTEEDKPATFETEQIKDIDGNIYTAVKIGNQWWMTTNLRATRFQDGTAIKLINEAEAWANTNEAAYCQYQNSELAPGFLYNAHVVNNNKKIAPEGWRVPTDEDWKELEKHSGMSNISIEQTNWRGETEGDKLKKEGSSASWIQFEDVWGTNEYGFSADAGSCRLFDGKYGIPGLKGSGFWWTSTAYNVKYTWYRYLDYKKSGIFRYYGENNYGFSIRCVKDAK